MFSATAQFHRSTTGSSSPAARAGWPAHILQEQSLSNSFNIQDRKLMVLTEISTKDKVLILELLHALTFVVGSKI